MRKRWSALDGQHTFEPVTYETQVLVGSSRGLYALRANDGSVAWHIEADSSIYTPLVADGIAYAGSENGTLYAVDAATGREHWHMQFPGWVYSPAMVDGILFTGGQHATLWALDVSSGKERWSQILPGELVFSPVAGPSGTVLATTFSADVIAYDASAGAMQWRLRTPTASKTPAVSGDTVLMAGLDGTLRKVRIGQGTIDWETGLSGRLSPPQILHDNHILVSNDDGKVYLLDGQDGTILGQNQTNGAAVGRPFVHRCKVFQFFQNSGQRISIAATEIPADCTTGQ